MSENILEVKNLVIKYGEFTAVDKLSFTIKKGEVYALLGPNGAGKTSTFECIEGLVSKQSGEIFISGKEINIKNGVEKSIGIQLQDSAFQKNMKVIEIIKMVSMYYNCDIDMELFERLNINEIASKMIEDISIGQRRKVSIYLAIMHHPKLLILDEPTAGLDVIAKNQIYDIIKEIRLSGTAVLISSHDMAEIEKISDRIGVIVKGKMLKEATTLEITNDSYGTNKIILKTDRNLENYKKIMEKYQFKFEQLDEGYVVVYVKELQDAMFCLINEIDKNNDRIIDLRIEKPSLEEIFMKITK